MKNKTDLKGIITSVIGMITFACTSVLMWASALEPSEAVLDCVGFSALLFIGIALGIFAAIIWFGYGR